MLKLTAKHSISQMAIPMKHFLGIITGFVTGTMVYFKLIEKIDRICTEFGQINLSSNLVRDTIKRLGLE